MAKTANLKIQTKKIWSANSIISKNLRRSFKYHEPFMILITLHKKLNFPFTTEIFSGKLHFSECWLLPLEKKHWHSIIKCRKWEINFTFCCIGFCCIIFFVVLTYCYGFLCVSEFWERNALHENITLLLRFADKTFFWCFTNKILSKLALNFANQSPLYTPTDSLRLWLICRQVNYYHLTL